MGESHAFRDYADWEAVAHFKAAFSHPDFRAAITWTQAHRDLNPAIQALSKVLRPAQVNAEPSKH